MRYFVPDLRVAEELPPQAGLEEKLGGVPWGLPPGRWPRCRACEGSMSLLAQLSHHPARLDLGRAGRVLLAFQCNHDPGMCETWAAGAGANACLVLEPEELVPGLTPLPDDAPVVEREARIAGWLERHDAVNEADRPAFFEEGSLLKLPLEIQESVRTGTRLGSVPYWIQSAGEAPRGWRFVGQLDSTLSFMTPPARPPAWVWPDRERYEGRTHGADWANFGDGGVAYLFLRDVAGGPPEGLLFWQCG